MKRMAQTIGVIALLWCTTLALATAPQQGTSSREASMKANTAVSLNAAKPAQFAEGKAAVEPTKVVAPLNVTAASQARPRQGGDTCADAFPIPSLPFDDTGTTVDYANDHDEVCPYTGSTSPDVAYVFTPASDITVDVSLCNDGTNYDTKLYIYQGACPGTLVACNDDSCNSPQFPSSYISKLAGIALTGGQTYYIIVDGYGGASGDYHLHVEAAPPLPDCRAGSAYSQPPSGPSGDWSAATSAVTSSFDYTVYENYTNSWVSVWALYWWGLSLHYSGGWSACDPTGMAFEVKFYQPGVQPGAVVSSSVVTPIVVDTGIQYAGFSMFYFSVLNLAPGTVPFDGWISIKSQQNPADCAFLWMSARSGLDAHSWQQAGTGPLADYNFDDAFCLPGYIVPSGACCIEATAECYDNVELLACMQMGGHWTEWTACADLQPSCGHGACCYDNGRCTSVVRARCGTLVGDANCDGEIDFHDINPFVEALATGDNGLPGCPVGNCDMDTDGVIDFHDINPFVAILSGGQPAPLGNYLGERTTCNQCRCTLVCPTGATPEDEPCGAQINGGCNHTPPVLSAIHCGETVCGTSWRGDLYYDEDWFAIQGLTGTNDLTIAAEAEFELQLMFIADVSGVCHYTIPGMVTAGSCVPVAISLPGMPAGVDYYVRVAPQLTTTFTCTEASAQYWVRLECTPVSGGACCVNNCASCVEATEEGCTALAGCFLGYDIPCDPNQCAGYPSGESCSTPRIINAVPYTDWGNTCGHVLDCRATCGANNAPDLVYAWTPTADGVATASLCGSSYDTVIHVKSTCPCGNDLVCNDDYCGLQSQASWGAHAGVTYYIYVSGTSTACGDYTLNLTVGPPCSVTCLGGATPEGEPCGTNTNGGCFDSPQHVFGAIHCGETIWGTSYYDAVVNDDDVFTVIGVNDSRIYTVTAEAEFNLQLILLSDAGECDTRHLGVAMVGPCVPATITSRCMSPGLYHVWVAPDWYQPVFGCTAGNPQYCVRLSCETCPPGDVCETALPIDAVPFDAQGNTCQFGSNYNPPTCSGCPYTTYGAPDVIYVYAATADDTWDVDLCNSPTNYDTKLWVYQDDCAGTPIACNDDYGQTPEFPINYVSRLPGVSIYAGHSYYVVIGGYSSVDCGDFHLTISQVPGLAGPPGVRNPKLQLRR